MHARLFLDELARSGRAPARFLALTHWHWDHVFGIAELNLPTIAQRETHQRVAEMARQVVSGLLQRLPGGSALSTALIGSNDGSGQFTIPQQPIRRRMQGLPAFVVNRGGEYCFMPGLRALRWIADLEA